MKNQYDISEDGQTVTIWLKYKDKRLSCLIDAKDLLKADQFPNTWYPMNRKGKTYDVVGDIMKNGTRKTLILHRVLMNPPEWLEVDHINHDGLDCRRVNLVVTTHSGSSSNRRGPASNGHTGHRGISLRRVCPYHVAVYIHGIQKSVGNFETLEEALAARNRYPQYAHSV